jgi:hypothetical protein
MLKQYFHINQVRILISLSVITGISLLATSPAISEETRYIENVKNVIFPSLNISLPRDNRFYNVPILVEGDYKGNDLKNNPGYFVLSVYASDNTHHLTSLWSEISVTESTKKDDKWKSLIYLRFACNSDGRAYSTGSEERTHKKIDLRLSFTNSSDKDKYSYKRIWRGVNIVCAPTAEMPEEESKYLVPYTPATAPEKGAS